MFDDFSTFFFCKFGVAVIKSAASAASPEGFWSRDPVGRNIVKNC